VKPSSFERQGDDWLVVWDDVGIGMAFSRLRETDAGQLYAELTVESLRSGEEGTLYWARVSLSAQADRDRLSKALKEVAPDVGWPSTLNRTFMEVAARERQPEPLVRLADVPYEGETAMAWEPVMPRGETAITMADGGSGKSYRAMVSSVCVAAGLPMPFGGPLHIQGPVIYLDYESHASAQRRRLERVCAGLGLRELPKELYFRHMRGKGRLLDHVRHVRADVDKVGAVYVVVDSLGWACGGDLTKTEVAIPTMDAIASLGKDVTKDVLAHFAKEHRESGKRASVYGSGFFEFAARSVWELRRESAGKGSFSLAMLPRKVNDMDLDTAGIGYRMAFNNERGTVTFTAEDVADSPELAEHLPLSARLRGILRDEMPYTKKELAELTNEKEETVKKALYRMKDIVTIGGKGQHTAYRLSHLQPVQKVEKRNGTWDTPYRDVPVPFQGGTKGQGQMGQDEVSHLKEDPEDLMNLPF
jgi:hypothetical protein